MTFSGRFLKGPLLWLSFAAIAAAAALYGALEIPSPLSLYTSASDAAWVFGGDLGHYQNYAEGIIGTGSLWISWLPSYFPPGFPILVALIFKTVGKDHYLLHLLWITCAFWATALFSSIARSFSFLTDGFAFAA